MPLLQDCIKHIKHFKLIGMKILIVRFSSIGDIVLTTPIVRCVKTKYPNCEIHFLTKLAFTSILEENPHIDKLIGIKKSIKEVLPELLLENYDHVVDLHKNIRTLSLKKALKKPSSSFSKLNFKKWLLVALKMNFMPKIHVVERYFQAVKVLDVTNDQQVCDFFISEQNHVDVFQTFHLKPKSFVGIAIGAQFATKRLPYEKLMQLIQGIQEPILLLGGPSDLAMAEKIQKETLRPNVQSTCGLFNLQQSASIVSQAKKIVTHDTGLMHIASCFEIPIVSIWGNTVPSLGMFPYSPQKPSNFTVHQVDHLTCRPCSKIGSSKCPKGHFHCMEWQDINQIIEDVNKA
jgi:ADP-heptose:LPS heptosyltransferase